MKIYDCDLRCGYYPGTKPCLTIEELLAATGRCGVDGGLIRISTTDMSGLGIGNAMLAQALKDMPEGYYGMWAITPSCVGETPKPEALPKEMAKNRIAALYINPSAHGFLPRPSVMGDYYEMAQERNIPIYMCTDYGLTLDDIDDIMTAFPNLVCILNNCGSWPSMRKLYPFLENYPKLMLDLAYQMDDQGIEDITRRYGAGRMLMGSYFPKMYIGGMLTYVHCAEISDADKDMILGGNFERMLREERL